MRESSVFSELCLIFYKVGKVKNVRWAAWRIGEEQECCVFKKLNKNKVGIRDILGVLCFRR